MSSYSSSHYLHNKLGTMYTCIVVCLCVLGMLLPGGRAFSNGAPSFSCKDPSTFHTRKINDTHEGIIMPQAMATNPYRIDVSPTTFGPGDRVTVTLYTQEPDQVLRGFFLQAVQADIHIRDLRRRAFGRFVNLTTNEAPSECQTTFNVVAGGATHTNNRVRRSLTVVWLAPETYNPGTVQFLATGVFNYDTYWTNIRSGHLTPTAYETISEDRAAGQLTPTAAWYRWLQYLRQNQLLRDNIGQVQGTRAESTQVGGVNENSNTPTRNSQSSGRTASSTTTHSTRHRTTVTTPGNTGNTARGKRPSQTIVSPQLTIHDHAHPDHDHAIHHS